MGKKIKLNSRRIVKNTLMLYFRMFLIMGVGLYTSRVILETLGVEDFGIYNVVGGFVALFAVVSKSLSGATSRFLNFEMGRGNMERLKCVFSSTILIQISLAVIVLVLAEIIGTWFLNNKMVIPADRMAAAKICFQLSVAYFCIHLVSIPYNAAIIAHERMKTFAYVSIFEAVSKLIISFAIVVSPIDKLVFYAILLCALQVAIQIMYMSYCRIRFEECKLHFIYDKVLLKELFSYAGWGFIGSTSGVLRNQGINVLINLFFGPTINAARAVSNQVLHAVDSFVLNFMTAVRPQITQSYAAQNLDDLNKLIYNSTKFSYYLFLFLSMPIILNAQGLLHLWLKNVPDHAVLFVQLTLIYTMITTLSHPLSIAQAATGKIRDYQLVIGGMQLLNLPISYVFLKCGFPAEIVLVVAICIATCVVFLSIYMIKKLIPLDVLKFVGILFKVFVVTVIAYSLPMLAYFSIPFFKTHTIVSSILCALYTACVIVFVGCKSTERKLVVDKICQRIRKK